MIETPQIVQTEEQLIASIHVTVPRAQIREVMGPGIAELMMTVAGQGVATTGPWLTHHLKMSPETFDFEICVPVAKPVTESGRVKPGKWPAMRVARTVYHGTYEGLGPAWGEFEKWIKENGHQSAQDLWEVYSIGPEKSPDPAAWRTELSRPLA